MGNEIVILLKGLTCANCANKIETRVKNYEEVEAAELNFAKSTLKIKVKEAFHKEQVFNKVKKLVNELEPHVEVIKIARNIAKPKNGHVHQGNESHHDHNHDHHHELKESKDFVGFLKNNLMLIIGILFYGVALYLKSESYSVYIFILSYLIVGKSVLTTAVKNILRGEVFDENFLMAVATLGAMIIGEYPEGIAVMVFYEIGEIFQGYAVNKSRKSISELMDIRPDSATVIINGVESIVEPEAVNVGQSIVVKPGERVPLDGIVEDGTSFVDTSALTGESVPRKISVGETILAGGISTNGLLKIKVTKPFAESTVSRILELVENASSKKAKTERFITKFAKVYTPIVVFSALAVAIIPPMFLGFSELSTWVYRALLFLVVSCPCALVVSIPLGMFAGIGGASKKGVLVKGGNYLEILKSVDTVVFDKTGTLTKGVFTVNEIKSDVVSEDELLEIAALGESKSNHPIAQSILKSYGKTVTENEVSEYSEIAGHGIKVKINDELVLLGNEKLMEQFAIEYHKISVVGTVVHIAREGKYLGYIVISDQVKDTAAKAIKNLKEIGVNKIFMLTGDNNEIAHAIGKELKLDRVYGGLLPNEKVEKVEALIKEGCKLAFVGDGINDAPVLARADVGVAMGGIGSDAAIEAADVVLMNDDPMAMVKAIKISRKTSSILLQNIIFALGIKLLVLILGLFGMATMWEAVFADVGVTILAVINSSRALR